MRRFKKEYKIKCPLGYSSNSSPNKAHRENEFTNAEKTN